MTDVHRVLASRMAASWRLHIVFVVLACVSRTALSLGEDAYFGKHLGKLKELHHGVSGDVYAVDARTLHIRDFTYDGEGPAAYFYVGSSKTPSGAGTRINDEKGSPNVLPRYRKKHITLTLPEGKTLTNIKWFAVWCDEFSVNFGDVRIPKGFAFPKPQKLEALKGIHGVSSENVVIVDAQTLLVPSFSYDGEAPDAKFWVGPGPKPNPQGIRIPDENGKKEHPLRRYDQKTIVLTLPGDMTVFDIGHFGVWCEAFAVDFAHIKIPKTINVPPSLKMLGVSPQSKLNCEVLWDDLAFEVRWAVAGDSIVLQLVSKLEDGEYMSFGLSGLEEKSRMIGGDVVVAWVDKETLKGYTDDYFLDAKSQCSGNRGSCPDKHLREGTGSVRLLNAAMVNGYSIVTYQRPLLAQDELDKTVMTNGSQAVIWAIGPLNSKNEVSYHSLANRNNLMLDFGRSPKWNCPLPESSKPEETEDPISSMTSSLPSKAKVEKLDGGDKTTILSSNQRPNPSTAASVQKRPPATPAPVSKRNAWEIPPIQCNEPEDGVFYAQMGPTGGKRGYPAITGHVGWGISWYINGLLIPEINVVRGKTYTFVVEGGLDADTPARYHPFYITDDPVGGYEHKTPEERAEVRVFAGVKQNRRGDVYPSGTGRLCNWTPDQNQPLADEFASFGAYQRTLTLECDEGEPGVVQWTPDDNTPDTVYYQCYTHRYLGWKINVLDSCDVTDAAASDQVLSIATPDDDQEAADEEDAEGELQSRPSIQVNYRVKPNDVYNKGVDESKGDKEFATKPYPKFPENHQHEYSTYVFSHPSEPSGEDTYHKEKVVNAQQYNYHHRDEAHEDAFVPPPALQKETFNPQYSLQHQEYINETRSEEIKQKQEVKDIKPHTYEATQKFVVEVKPDQKPSYPIKTSPYHLPMRTHYPMSMLNHGRLPLGVHPMAFTRGPQFTSYRRPIPMNSYPPRPPMYRPSYSSQNHQKLMLSTKKPIYRVPAQVPQMSQHRPMIIPFHRPMVYQQNPHFTTRMPQRIIPLQHAAPSKVYSKVTQLPKVEKPIQVAAIKVEKESSVMQPSTLISTNRPFEKKHSSYEAAVNTGFKPETVIVEGGFKPIVTVNKDVAQDRSSQVDVEMEYGEQEVKVDEPERPQASYNEDLVNDATQLRDANPFENIQHEMFEPMFIPSPLDRMSAKNKAKPSISDDLTPPERAKTHNRKSSHMTRVRPGLVRRPFYPDNIVPPFRIPTRGGSASFRQASDDSEDEQAMAAERQETFYLPPAEYVETEGVVAFDGKSVSDLALPAVAADHQLPQTSEDLVRGTPQFGPFRGEGPPPIPDDVRPETIPHLTYSNRQKTPELPVQFNQGQDFPDPPPIRSTHLTLVSQLQDDKNTAEFLPEASELKEAYTNQPGADETTLIDEGVTKPLPVTEDKAKATDGKSKKYVESEEEKVRNKRDADHEPGHVGPHDHSHHDHDHSHHDHHDMKSTGGRVAAISVLAAVLNLAVVMFL